MATNRNAIAAARGRGIPMHEAPLTEEEKLCFRCPLSDCLEGHVYCLIRVARKAAQIQRGTARRINRYADEVQSSAGAAP